MFIIKISYSFSLEMNGGESGYLEPDEKFQYGYLEAIKNALVENNEF